MKWIRFWSCWSLLSLLQPIFSAVMWSLPFPFFWSCVSHYMRFTTLRTRPLNSHCSSMPDLLTCFTSLDTGFWPVVVFRRLTRLIEGPTLQYVCRRNYIFKWKTQKLSLRDIKKVRWLWLSRRVVRVVYGSTTPLRRQELMTEILNSSSLIVNLSW